MVVYLYSTRQITKVWAEAKRTWREAVNRLRRGEKKGREDKQYVENQKLLALVTK